MKKTNTIAACALLSFGISAFGSDTEEVRAVAADSLRYGAEFIGSGATKDFAPYMLGSWSHGKTVMGGNALVDVSIVKDFNMGRRFSWEAGAELVTGYTSRAPYAHYDAKAGAWLSTDRGPAAGWIQQLWGAVKYRGVFLSAGMRDHDSEIVDDTLSSGDLIQSNNARAIPEVRIGFIDFQNIPFTRGWAQIKGCISYGKMADSDYLENRYNYWNNHINTGALYTYKNIYFRSKPTERFVAMIGIQCAGTFGGTSSWYSHGKQTHSQKNKETLRAFWDMFIPSLGNGDGYVEGSHLGTWEFRGTYRLGGGHSVMGYFEWLWEDGSSMGKRNKWDGLWGIEYRREGRHFLEGAVAEYIDFRDQSGPIHWAPGDAPGTTITTEATGGDDYYNNTTMNAFANYGMSIGSPFVVSPVYNTDGFIQYKYTRSRGFHFAARGSLSSTLRWRAMVSHASAWGSGRFFYPKALKNTSAMLECRYDAARLLKGLSASAALAFDAGRLRGNNFGGTITVTYTGNFSWQ